MDRCVGTWQWQYSDGKAHKLRCERPYDHNNACWAQGVAWALGPNIIVNLDGPPTATSTPQHRNIP